MCGILWIVVILIVECFLFGLMIVLFLVVYFDVMLDVIVMDDELDIVVVGLDVGIWLGEVI